MIPIDNDNNDNIDLDFYNNKFNHLTNKIIEIRQKNRNSAAIYSIIATLFFIFLDFTLVLLIVIPIILLYYRMKTYREIVKLTGLEFETVIKLENNTNDGFMRKILGF